MRKGFTLIELLAVIVILAIIALISTPIVIGVIEKARQGSFINSGYGILDAAKLAVIEDTYLYNKKIDVTGNFLKYSGEVPLGGYAIVQRDGKEAIKIKNKDYCAVKEFDENKIHITSYEVCDMIEVDTPLTSMYNWQDELLIGYKAKDSLDLMKRLFITRVYQDVDGLENAEIESLIKLLSKNKIEFYTLTGAPAWWNQLPVIQDYIDIYRKYNEGKKEEEKIKGIAFDIEFYLDDAWDTDPENVLSTYVNTIKEATNYAHSSGLEIVLALPSWLDRYDESYLSKLIEVADMTSIMNYDRASAPTSLTKEVELAKKYGKPLEHISNFGPPSNAEDVGSTFWPNSVSTALTEWNVIKENAKYKDLTFSYHSLRSLLYLEKNYKQLDIFVKDKDGNPIRTEIGIKVNQEFEYHKSKSSGKVTFVIPKDDPYEIIATSYEIQSKTSPTNTTMGETFTLSLGEKKPKYTEELYFYIWNKNTNKYERLNSTKVTFTSKETGVQFSKTTHATEGYIASSSFHFNETYQMQLEDGKQYEINMRSENSGIKDIYHVPGDGDYIIEDVYFKER